MIKNIFFDFNGTIIDDVDLCLDLLNVFLKEQNKPLCTKEKYKDIFTFPIRDYYIAAGIDFNLESYESLSVRFIRDYQPASMHCGLYKGSIELFEKLNQKGINLYILSASEKNNLVEQCQNYKIDKYFKAILGIDNIQAAGKTDIAINYINERKLNRDETIFIGDTLHDYEVSKAMGVDCRLVACGHQSEKVLKTAGVPILNSICDIINEV